MGRIIGPALAGILLLISYTAPFYLFALGALFVIFLITKQKSPPLSKSKDDLNGTIYFDDSKDEIIKKFKSSVTDSENEIKFDNETKKGISNLIDIYSTLHELTHADVENKFKNSSYGEFKIEVGESVVSYLEPIKERYDSLSEGDVASLIKDNLDDVKNSAKKTMDEVSAVVGV